MKSVNLSLYRNTKRLIVRPLEVTDFENWQQSHSNMKFAQNDWDMSPWKDSELTLAKFKVFLKNQKTLRSQDKFYHFGIFRKDDGVLIGEVSLMDLSRQVFQNAYLGYRIYNIYWGQGYAQEASKAALEIAFKELNLHRVEAGIAPKNKKSIVVAKKIGLKKEGLSPKRLFVNNKWSDMENWAATCEDFKKKYKFKK